ncbi:hypothetical protein CU044_0360 [Streptomyces sp. L-9-10]|nr:hypothetical protein CU044_0360 [Streptomyces sp. L-9-10]
MTPHALDVPGHSLSEAASAHELSTTGRIRREAFLVPAS